MVCNLFQDYLLLLYKNRQYNFNFGNSENPCRFVWWIFLSYRFIVRLLYERNHLLPIICAQECTLRRWYDPKSNPYPSKWRSELDTIKVLLKPQLYVTYIVSCRGLVQLGCLVPVL